MKQQYRPVLQPKTHQRVGINELMSTSKANFDDQGLGKSKQAYDTAAQLIASQEIDLMILIVKASLRQNIYREILNDGKQLVPIVAQGTRHQRNLIYRTLACHVLILSYETVVADLETLIRIVKQNKTLVCLDESHSIKNWKTRRAEACIEIAGLATKTIIFSGTPAPNRMEDLYPQLRVLGHDVGVSVKEFRDRFKVPEQLRDFLSNKVIRRRKESLKELAIPGKEIKRIRVPLMGEQLCLYQDAERELVLLLRNLRGETETIELSNFLARLLRLIQIASNPRLLTDAFQANPAKFSALDKLLDQEVGEGNRKVIIWTSFRKNVEELTQRYSRYGAVALYGGVKRGGRDHNVRSFQESEDVRVLVGIPACGREGFTLTRASTAIYLDRSFSYLDWAQSQDRIHRISQKRDCKIYVLEATGSADERVDEILERKKQLQAFLLGETEFLTDPDLITVEEALEFLETGKEARQIV